MIVGIILSAGESKRMGTPKQLLPWGNTFILQQVINTAEASQLIGTVVVLGHRADEIAGKLKVSPKTRIAINKQYPEGMNTSIVCGVDNIPAEPEAVMLLLGDQPQITTSIINTLIDTFRSVRNGIIIPVYNGKRGHPVIFDSRYMKALLSIGNRGAKEIIDKHADDICEVPVETPDILVDIDTPEDYEKAKEQNGD